MGKIPKKFLSGPQKNETELGKQTIDRIVKQRTFQPYDKPQLGSEFFIFKQPGDQIIGTIVGGPIVNIQRSSSYAIELEDGKIVEIFANKLLHQIIKEGELLFSRVRIQFIGREHSCWGHARKIYRVYKIKGTYTQTEESVIVGGKKCRKKKKAQSAQTVSK